MKKLACFVLVGLAFVALQVATVEAAHTASHTSTGGTGVTMMDPPDCPAGTICGGDAASHPCSDKTGDDLIKCTEENSPIVSTGGSGAVFDAGIGAEAAKAIDTKVHTDAAAALASLILNQTKNKTSFLIF